MLEAFDWIIKDRVAGSGKPGLMGDAEDDYDFLWARGIRTLVTLTERTLEPHEKHEFRRIHFPIPDMGVTSPARCVDLCQLILATARPDHRVLIHCRAGLGRTGTLGAALLVASGLDSATAIQEVRMINHRYIQSQSQLRFVEHFAQHLTSEWNDSFEMPMRRPGTLQGAWQL